SEAPAIDVALRADLGGLPEADRVAVLRALVSALGQPRAGERHLFVKLDAWATPLQPLIKRAFPEVPWIFAYRDPLVVVGSQCRDRGLHTVPGAFDPRLFGMDPAEVPGLSPEVHVARVLAAICAAGLRFIDERALLIEYRSLPSVVFTDIAPHFGLAL